MKKKGMTEEEFLKSTPRKLFKLADIHLAMNSPKEEKPKETYIDNLIL